MKILDVSNVHCALPEALRMLETHGYPRNSRNGPVLMMDCPVSTVYRFPEQRVLLWPGRDANPFLHLYESLWMLAGRNDVAPLLRYAKQFKEFSDDGVILHGAYGYRWRFAFDPIDQLEVIAERLHNDPNDRRCVLQMWDANFDLGFNGKDVPCNTMATFQRGRDGELNLTVFCRSNDVIWGAYGANAVHFSFLQEYMARWIGCRVGTYTQVSVNWHAYVNVLNKMKDVPRRKVLLSEDPYTKRMLSLPMPLIKDIRELDTQIRHLLHEADTNFQTPEDKLRFDNQWFKTIYGVLKAHHIWRTYGSLVSPSAKFQAAVHCLPDTNYDWVVAAYEWLLRRKVRAESRIAQV